MNETYARLQTARARRRQRQEPLPTMRATLPAYVAQWLFVSLLVGAFVVSLSATYGGRQRDT